MKTKFEELYLGNYVFEECRDNDIKYLKYEGQVIRNLCEFINQYFSICGKIETSEHFLEMWKNFYYYVVEYIKIFHYGENKNSKKSINTILDNMNFHSNNMHNFGIKYTSIPTIFENENLRATHFEFISTIYESEVVFEKFVHCCGVSIKRYIASKSFTKGIKVEKVANLYESFLPNDTECIDIILNIISDFNQYFIDVVIRIGVIDEISLETKKANQELFDSLNEKGVLCKNQEDKIKKLEKEVERLQEILSKKEIKDNSIQEKIMNDYCENKTKQMKDENVELLRKNAKLERQLLDIKEKYRNVQTSNMYEPKEEIRINDIEQCDVSKKYGFVVGDNSNIQNNLLSMFNNSVILSEKTKTLDVECIVFMTSCIGHSFYYKIKNMCDNQGIPYIHCVFKNVNCVKDVISKSNIV